MSQTYFGATRTDFFSGHQVFEVPIARIKCTQCGRGLGGEYIAWANADTAEVVGREASGLLTELIERDHPHHRPAVYGGSTLEELRQQTQRKFSAAGS
jgi:hypothetical protein